MKFLAVFALSALAIVFMAGALSFSRYRKRKPACCAENPCPSHTPEEKPELIEKERTARK